LFVHELPIFGFRLEFPANPALAPGREGPGFESSSAPNSA
jgi:hypothetical protein